MVERTKNGRVEQGLQLTERNERRDEAQEMTVYSIVELFVHRFESARQCEDALVVVEDLSVVVRH